MTSLVPSRLLLALVLSLLSVACGGGAPPAAPDEQFDDGTPGDPSAVVLPAGYDCWSTESGHVNIELPPDFFGPGSAPFTGRIDLEGVPLETAGPFELGDTDTVLRREADMLLPAAGEQSQVAIELVALNLQSVQPIVVQTVTGSESWDMSMSLSARDEFGALEAVLRNDTSYGFRATLPVRPVLVFTNPANPGVERQLTLDTQVLEGAGDVLDLDADASDAGLLVPFLDLGPQFDSFGFRGIDMSLRLQPAQADANRPLGFISPSANVEVPNRNIGRNAQVGELSSIGTGTLVGPNAVIGTDCLIGRGVLIAERAVIGDGTVIEDGAIIGGDVQLGTGCFVGAGAQVHRQSNVGPDCTIGAEAYIGARCLLGSGATLHTGSCLKNGVQLGNQVVVDEGIRLAAETVVIDGVNVTEDLLLGQLADGTLQHGTRADLEAAGAAILGNVSVGPIANPDIVQSEVVSEVPLDPNALPAGLANLQQDVNTAGTGTTAGPIKDRTYVRTTYDCDDFADDMEVALTAKGYTATFTVYYCWDSIFEGEPDAWRMPWEYTPSLLRGHAVTDIHHGGRVIWLEPQNGQVGIKLDFDNDGRTEYATNHNSRALTDGNYRIEVYPSRAAAERAGVVLD